MAGEALVVGVALRDRLAGVRIEELTADTFDGFVRVARVAFVDFWAAWCRPCRAMAPVIRSLAKEYADVAFAKVDTEAEKGLAERFRIRGIPTYVLFKKGRVVDRFSGVATRNRLAQKIEKWR